MKFKYVGAKTDGERAFQKLTGIEWLPGDVKDVTSSEAIAQMLQHPTVWEPIGKVSLADAKIPAAPLVNVGHVSDEDVLDEAEAREKAAREAKDGLIRVVGPAADAIASMEVADPLADLVDDDAVRAFAKDKGIKFNGIALFKGENLRAKVREALKG
jgi:hypothetical protein